MLNIFELDLTITLNNVRAIAIEGRLVKMKEELNYIIWNILGISNFEVTSSSSK